MRRRLRRPKPQLWLPRIFPSAMRFAEQEVWFPCCGSLSCQACNFGSNPTTWLADLGAGGWTNDKCTNCADVQGQYTLTQLDPLACWWRYVAGDLEECNYWGPNWAPTRIQVDLLHHVPGTGGWWWWVQVIFSSFPTYLSWADYKSDTTESKDCWALGGNGAGDKITLTKWREQHDLNLCQGTLPNTIEIWVP